MKLVFFCAVAIMCVPVHAGEAKNETLIKNAVANTSRPEEDRVRDAGRKPEEILKFFGVAPGMTIADVFAGSGYYTELMSAVVGPKGTVYMQNNLPWLNFVGSQVESRLKDNRLPNVKRLNTEAPDLKLPVGKLDLITFFLGFHDLYYSHSRNWPPIDANHFIAQLYSGLKPGGTLAVVDHAAAANTNSESAQQYHRIDPVFTRKVIEKAGFVLVKESKMLENPKDGYDIVAYEPSMKGKTDRFVFMFKKPKK